MTFKPWFRYTVNNIVQLDLADTKIVSQDAVNKALGLIHVSVHENTQTLEVNSNFF